MRGEDRRRKEDKGNERKEGGEEREKNEENGALISLAKEKLTHVSSLLFQHCDL